LAALLGFMKMRKGENLLRAKLEVNSRKDVSVEVNGNGRIFEESNLEVSKMVHLGSLDTDDNFSDFEMR
jgi:hypothetical protein